MDDVNISAISNRIAVAAAFSKYASVQKANDHVGKASAIVHVSRMMATQTQTEKAANAATQAATEAESEPEPADAFIMMPALKRMAVEKAANKWKHISEEEFTQRLLEKTGNAFETTAGLKRKRNEERLLEMNQACAAILGVRAIMGAPTVNLWVSARPGRPSGSVNKLKMACESVVPPRRSERISSRVGVDYVMLSEDEDEGERSDYDADDEPCTVVAMAAVTDPVATGSAAVVAPVAAVMDPAAATGSANVVAAAAAADAVALVENVGAAIGAALAAATAAVLVDDADPGAAAVVAAVGALVKVAEDLVDEASAAVVAALAAAATTAAAAAAAVRECFVLIDISLYLLTFLCIYYVLKSICLFTSAHACACVFFHRAMMMMCGGIRR